MTTPPANPAAIILGGGQSRRFGSEKGLATWHGVSLVDHVLQRLPQPRGETVLVLRTSQSNAWQERDRVTIVHDHDAHAGPLRGIIRGLEHLAGTATWAWVVACDQPLISTTTLRGLTSLTTANSAAVIPVWETRLQPLTGLYRVAAAAHLRACHENGETSIVRALNTVGHLTVDSEQCRRWDPHGLGFRNVNRPDDLTELDRLLAKGPHREL